MKSIKIGYIKTKYKNINLYARVYTIDRKEFVVIYYFPRYTKNTPPKEKTMVSIHNKDIEHIIPIYKQHLTNNIGISFDVEFDDYTPYLKKIYKKYGKWNNYLTRHIKKRCFVYPAYKIDEILKKIKEQDNVYIKIDNHKKMKLTQLAMEV